MSANLTSTSNYHPQPYGLGFRTVFLPVQALAVVYEGAMVSQIAGACVTATTAGCGHVIGVSQEPVVTGGATDGAVRMVVMTDSIFLFNADTDAPVDSTPYGTVLYAKTDNTVGTGAGAETVIAGRFMGIQDDGLVRVYVSNQASWFDTFDVATSTRQNYCRNVCTTFTASSYTGTGTGVLSFANHLLDVQDGVTNVVGDGVFLPGGTLGSCAITAADVGPYVVTALGGASAKAVFTRPSWWQNGSIVPTSQSVKIGSEGTLFGNTDWTSSAAPGCVVGTTDPAMYPDRVTQEVTLGSSTKTITNVPILSATKSNVIATLAQVGGTTTNTVGYGTIVAPTPGYIGTASTVVDALNSGMAKNSTLDTSILTVTIVNR